MEKRGKEGGFIKKVLGREEMMEKRGLILKKKGGENTK